MMRGALPHQPIRVLTVEPSDEASPDIAAQLTSTDEHALTVQTVSGADAALERLRSEHVDCVVCLHDPPTSDGFEVVDALREEHPRLPILFATDGDVEDVGDRGLTDVVGLTDGKLEPMIATNRISSVVSPSREREKYHQIFDQANDGIIVHDPDSGDILDANRRLYRLLGYDPEARDGLSVSDIVADRDEYTEADARKRVQQVAESGAQTFEWLNRTADGDTVWVEVSLEPATIAGDDRVLAFIRDITDRKESERLLRDREQQLEAVFDHPSSFAVVLDGTGRVLRANRPALDVLDATATNVEGELLWETPWWTDDEAARIRRAVDTAAAGETSRLEVEIASDAARRTFDLHVEPVLREGDGVENVVVAGYDITERKQREEELRANRDTLQRLHEITATPDVSFEEQVERLLEFGADQFGMDIAFLSRIDEETGEFEVLEARGDHELIQQGSESALAETYCRHTIDPETEEPLGIEHAAEEMGDDPAYEKYGLGCYLGDTITVDGDVYGTLCFADEDVRDVSFTSEEKTLLDIMTQWLEQELAQREYQRELEHARNRVETTLERVDDAFFAVDDEWYITYVNEVGAEVLRSAMDAEYDAEDLVGRHLWGEIPDAVGTTFYERYHEALETQEPAYFEEYYEPLDVWFDVSVYPDENGLSMYFTDVTERKEREREMERLRKLLEQTEHIADVGGWEIDADGREVFWSDHLFDLLGIEGDEEPPLDEALDVYLEEDRPIIEDAVEDALDSAEPFDVELRYRRSADDVRWLRVQGVPVVEDGTGVALRGAAQDITERKQYERTLNDLLQVTRRFARARSRNDLLDAILDGLETVFGHEISSVRLHDPGSGTLPPTRISSSALEHVPDPPTYDADEGLVGEVFQTGEPAVVDDLSAAVEHDYKRVEAGMFIPIDDHGVIGIAAPNAGAFDGEDVALVELLALTAAGAFDRLERETEMRHLTRIVEHVDEKVFLLDETGTFTYTTPTLATYLGYDRTELVELGLVDIVADDAVEACEAALERVLTDPDESVTVEVDVRLSDEESRPVQLELSAMDGSHATVEIAGVMTDISELAETRRSLETERERFHTLFENLPDPVVEVDFNEGDPVVQYVNPAFTEVFGYDRETANAANLNALIVPDAERESATDLDARVMRGEVTSATVQRETERGRRDFLLRGIPYSRDAGTYGFGVYTDITEQKERERYLQVLNRVLRHNLRNDMNVVMALAERLAEKIEDDTLAGYARTLQDNAADVATLSEKAKEIERVLGRRGSETGRVDIAAQLGTAVDEQRDAHPEADISVDAPAELWVAGDEYVRRACAELIENAIEHNEDDAPALRIDVSDQDDWVELRFHDNGPGIPDDEWRIVSGDEEISQLSHGSGLGLWLTRWIVESYGGELYRESAGDGTTVVLRLRRSTPGAGAEGTDGAEPA